MKISRLVREVLWEEGACRLSLLTCGLLLLFIQKNKRLFEKLHQLLYLSTADGLGYLASMIRLKLLLRSTKFTQNWSAPFKICHFVI